VFYVAEDGWGSDLQRVEVRRVSNGGPWQEIYDGEPADVAWRGGDVLVATEHSDGTERLMYPSLGKGFNAGTDLAVNVFGVLGYMVAVFLVFVVPGLILVWSITRRPSCEARTDRSALGQGSGGPGERTEDGVRPAS
jgi:hypothetical protein